MKAPFVALLLAAALLLPSTPGALADRSAVEAAGARGEAAVRPAAAADIAAAAGDAAAADDGAQKPAFLWGGGGGGPSPDDFASVRIDSFEVIQFDAAYRASDLRALIAGQVAAVAPVEPPVAILSLKWDASYKLKSDGPKSVGQVLVQKLAGVNVRGGSVNDPNAKLLGVDAGNPLQPAHVVAYAGPLGDVTSEVQTLGADSAVPKVQPVVFGANVSSCGYIVEALDDALERSVCEIAFNGVAARVLSWRTALPPLVDAPLVGGDSFSDFALAKTVVVNVGCAIDPTKPVYLGDCSGIAPPTAAASSNGNSGSGIAASARQRRDALVDQALQSSAAAAPAALAAPKSPLEAATAAAAPAFFFGGGGGGGLPPNTVASQIWAGLIGAAVPIERLRALRSGAATSARLVSSPAALWTASFDVRDADGRREQALARTTCNAGILEEGSGTFVDPKAKLFGVGANPLKPSDVVTFAGAVAPRSAVARRAGVLSQGPVPAEFLPGQPCAYVLTGVAEDGSEPCQAIFNGATTSAPTFPSILPSGAKVDVPLAPVTALSNYALRVATLVSYACKLSDTANPQFRGSC